MSKCRAVWIALGCGFLGLFIMSACVSDIADAPPGAPTILGNSPSAGFSELKRYGDSCLTDSDCPSHANHCVAEILGQRCTTTKQDVLCPDSRTCGKELGNGRSCEIDADCSGCYPLTGLCSDGKKCIVDADCSNPKLAKFCARVISPTKKCTEGADGQPCQKDGDCAPFSAHCAPSVSFRGGPDNRDRYQWIYTCQDGLSEARCSPLLANCASGYSCPRVGRCNVNHKEYCFLGETCTYQDLSGYCFIDPARNNICVCNNRQPCAESGHRSRCDPALSKMDGTNPACSDKAPICAKEQCSDGRNGANCESDRDCSPYAPICRNFMCSLAQPGEFCVRSEGCSSLAPYCALNKCVLEGQAGRPCKDSDDCDPNYFCQQITNGICPAKAVQAEACGASDQNCCCAPL